MAKEPVELDYESTPKSKSRPFVTSRQIGYLLGLVAGMLVFFFCFDSLMRCLPFDYQYLGHLFPFATMAAGAIGGTIGFLLANPLWSAILKRWGRKS